MKMMDMLKTKMKEKKPLSDMEKDAKLSVLGNLKDLLQKSMGSKLGEMKKVSVMADSEDALKEGLDKAKEVVDAAPEVETDSQEHEEEMKNPMEESEQIQGPTVEDLDSQIEELLKKKRQLEQE